ncbi:MAG: hypothetical protein KatS3mg104_2811 [Phycisphaerae bacterium]|nr:MAG: hypothetical protein KatS3mg104_2811 [Phycisphaerae bacterium]
MSRDVLIQITQLATVPFGEQRVIEWVSGWAESRPRIRLDRDRCGNLLLTLKGTRPDRRLVMVSHMDHPGFTATRMTGVQTLEARFNGGVQVQYFKGQRVRFYAPDREVVGTILDVKTDPSGRPIQTNLRVGENVPRGTIGMWDLGKPRIRKTRFLAGVCDDLAGVAAGLSVLDRLYNKRLQNPVCLLLTRAEEEGFIGAIEAASSPQLLRSDDRIISLECSAEQPYARPGDGVIVRTGDRTSIFHSALTRFLHQQADRLLGSDPTFRFQRALMPGGTCEATVFDAWNYLSAALCIPLCNYHNMNPQTGKISPESIDLRDWVNMVKLLTEVAGHIGQFRADHGELRNRLLKRFKRFKRLL